MRKTQGRGNGRGAERCLGRLWDEGFGVCVCVGAAACAGSCSGGRVLISHDGTSEAFL